MTQSEVAELKEYMDKRFMEHSELLCDRMDEGFAAVRQEMAAEFKNVRQEMSDEFKSVRQEMANGFATVDRRFTDLRAEMSDGFVGVGLAIDELSSLIDHDQVQRLARRSANKRK